MSKGTNKLGINSSGAKPPVGLGLAKQADLLNQIMNENVSLAIYQDNQDDGADN